MNDRPQDEHENAAALDSELNALVSRLIDGLLNDDERNRLSSLLSESPAVVRRYHELLDNHEALCTIYPGDVYESLNQSGQSSDAAVSSPSPVVRFRQNRVGMTAILISMATIVLLIFAIWSSLFSEGNVDVATITGVSGSLIWTGDRGEIEQDLSIGMKVAGGTIEGMTPESWFELTFRDGSTVMISGHSMLTFSERDQKEMRLREGNFSANVESQPAGKPMLVRTRTALLKVLGTRFTVNADLSSTVLDVSEGKVQATRLSDRQSAEVPANHRIVAAVGQKFAVEQRPDSVTEWTSRIEDGPDHMYGRWTVAENDSSDALALNTRPTASLKAIPYTTKSGDTIYTAACEVSIGDNPPTVLQPDSEIRVQGMLNSAHYVFVGVTVRTSDGEFAGRFQTIRPAEEFQSGEPFDLTLKIRDFTADPSLKDIRNTLPPVPFHLMVESVWCHTLKSSAGLAVTQLAITRPEGD